MFLRIVDWLPLDYAALSLRRWHTLHNHRSENIKSCFFKKLVTCHFCHWSFNSVFSILHPASHWSFCQKIVAKTMLLLNEVSFYKSIQFNIKSKGFSTLWSLECRDSDDASCLEERECDDMRTDKSSRCTHEAVISEHGAWWNND